MFRSLWFADGGSNDLLVELFSLCAPFHPVSHRMMMQLFLGSRALLPIRPRFIAPIPAPRTLILIVFILERHSAADGYKQAAFFITPSRYTPFTFLCSAISWSHFFILSTFFNVPASGLVSSHPAHAFCLLIIVSL